MSEFVSVILFDEEKRSSILLVKNRPEEQAGRLNFPGGKIEEKDFPHNSHIGTAATYPIAARHAAIREVREEVGLTMPAESMRHFLTLAKPGAWRIFWFAAVVPNADYYTAKAQTDERMIVRPIDGIMLSSLPMVEYARLALKLALEEGLEEPLYIRVK